MTPDSLSSDKQRGSVISLIGMSGSGKSFWSRKLAEIGFERFCCDDLIEVKLTPELQSRGLKGIEDVAKWMGQPFDRQYPAASKKYLDFESEVMEEVLGRIGSSGDRNVVIDTTGSVIYLGERVLDKLNKLTKIVYLETPLEVQERMYQLYLKEPKPVIWGEVFERKKGENDMEALVRCYPLLLQFRSGQYERLAERTINYESQHDPDYDIKKFLKEIQR